VFGNYFPNHFLISTQRVIDTLLAATAFVHALTLVTRNTSDMQDIDVKLLDPWQGK
jgi:predicted nucleic acid-binding protein